MVASDDAGTVVTSPPGMDCKGGASGRLQLLAQGHVATSTVLIIYYYYYYYYDYFYYNYYYTTAPSTTLLVAFTERPEQLSKDEKRNNKLFLVYMLVPSFV